MNPVASRATSNLFAKLLYAKFLTGELKFLICGAAAGHGSKDMAAVIEALRRN